MRFHRSPCFILASVLSACSVAPVPSGNRPPVILAKICQEPAYPKEAKQAGQAGTVTLRFLISTQGNVLESEVVSSSGFPQLDQAAATDLSKCLFSPGTQGGVPTEMWSTLKWTWRLPKV